MEAVGSVLTNKYAEGLPGKRYYGGCEFVDKAERLAIDRAKELFGAEHANVQPHSGASANQAVYLRRAGDRRHRPGDGPGPGRAPDARHEAELLGPLVPDDRLRRRPQDRADRLRQARRARPRAQAEADPGRRQRLQPRIIDFDTIAEIAREVGAVFFVDMAHIAGLVAAGLPSRAPSRWPTSSRPPRTRPCAARAAGSSCASRTGPRSSTRPSSPASRAGRLMHVIAGKAVCFGEALRPEFKAYAAQVIANAKALAEELTRAGFRLVSGGTDNHLILIDMTSKGLTGKIAEAALGRAGITVNKNLIPFDTAQADGPERHPHGHARPDDPRACARTPSARSPPGSSPSWPTPTTRPSPAGSAARSASSPAITPSRPTPSAAVAEPERSRRSVGAVGTGAGRRHLAPGRPRTGPRRAAARAGPPSSVERVGRRGRGDDVRRPPGGPPARRVSASLIA